MTVLRSVLVRARIEKPVRPELIERSRQFCALFNGDLRSPSIQHFCYGDCCDHQRKEVTVEKMTALMMDIVFSQLGNQSQLSAEPCRNPRATR